MPSREQNRVVCTVAIGALTLGALRNVCVVLSRYTVDGSNIEEAAVARSFLRCGHPSIQGDEENSPLIGLRIPQLSNLESWSNVATLAARKAHNIALSSFDVAVLGIVINGVCENGSGGKCQDRK